MDKKIMIKWLCITLMCALLFGALGYAYGAMVTSEKCNALLQMKDSIDGCEIQITNNIPGTITNQTRFDWEYMQNKIIENVTPINAVVNP
jgi:hypothetical protein